MHNCGSSWGSKGMEGEAGRLVTKPVFETLAWVDKSVLARKSEKPGTFSCLSKTVTGELMKSMKSCCLCGLQPGIEWQAQGHWRSAWLGDKQKLLSLVWLFARPWTILVHEVLQARILEWVAVPFSRESSQPRDWTWGLLHYRQILYQLSYQRSPGWEIERAEYRVEESEEMLRPMYLCICPSLNLISNFWSNGCSFILTSQISCNFYFWLTLTWKHKGLLKTHFSV